MFIKLTHYIQLFPLCLYRVSGFSWHWLDPSTDWPNNKPVIECVLQELVGIVADQIAVEVVRVTNRKGFDVKHSDLLYIRFVDWEKRERSQKLSLLHATSTNSPSPSWKGSMFLVATGFSSPIAWTGSSIFTFTIVVEMCEGHTNRMSPWGKTMDPWSGAWWVSLSCSGYLEFCSQWWTFVTSPRRNWGSRPRWWWSQSQSPLLLLCRHLHLCRRHHLLSLKKWSCYLGLLV